MVSALPALDNTMGCLFLSGIFCTALWGVAAVQLYIYYEKYWKTDKPWLKLYMLCIFLLDTAHQIILVQALYNYFIKEFANYAYLFTPQASLVNVSVFAAIIDAMVQSIFLMRVWTLSNGSYILTGVLVIPVIGLFVVSLTFFGEMYGITKASQLLDTINIARVMNSLVVLADTAIAVVLIFLLRNMRSGFRKTDSVIARLVIYTISTGAITSVWATVGMITAITMPKSFLYLMVDIVMPKLYLNCVLASLNSRSKLRDNLVGGSQGVSIHLNDTGSGTSEGSSPMGDRRKAVVTRAVECKVDIDIGDDSGRQMKVHRLAPNDMDIEAARSSA